MKILFQGQLLNMCLTFTGLSFTLHWWNNGVNSESIRDCVNGLNTTPTESLETRRIHPFHLYKVRGQVTWCESHRFCLSMNQRLLTLKDGDQNAIFMETMANHYGDEPTFLWLSARRKDYGQNWTWVNDSLTDCERECSTLRDNGVYANVFVKPSSTLLDNEVLLRGGLQHICHMQSGNSLHLGWYDAQNACSRNGLDIGNRLSTLAEILSMREKISSFQKYWLTLYYRPWIWIEGTTYKDYRPLKYFAFNLTTTKSQHESCLGVVMVNGVWTWVPKSCDQQADGYVMCVEDSAKLDLTSWGQESEESISTLTSLELHPSEENLFAFHWGYQLLIWSCCAFVGVLLILCTITGVTKLRRRHMVTIDTATDGVAPASLSSENPSGDEDIQMTPLTYDYITPTDVSGVLLHQMKPATCSGTSKKGSQSRNAATNNIDVGTCVAIWGPPSVGEQYLTTSPTNESKVDHQYLTTSPTNKSKLDQQYLTTSPTNKSREYQQYLTTSRPNTPGAGERTQPLSEQDKSSSVADLYLNTNPRPALKIPTQSKIKPNTG